MNTALKKAYDLERKGLDAYIDLAAMSKNALARKTLFSLASAEIEHMMKIDDIAFSMDKKEPWASAETSFKASDIEIKIKDFFVNTKKEALDQSSDDAGIIKKAMDFERKSYELYSDLSKKAGSDAERRFYKAMMKQEELHYDALENVNYYLTRTGDWFCHEESKRWNWMNI